MTAIQTLCDEMTSLGEMAEQIREQLVKGEVPDLTALSDRTAAACRMAQGLAPPDRERVFPAILVLMDMINRLSETLQAARDDLAADIKRGETQRRAFTAYNRPPDKKN